MLRYRSMVPLGIPHYTTQEENVRKLSADNLDHLIYTHTVRWIFDSERYRHNR